MESEVMQGDGGGQSFLGLALAAEKAYKAGKKVYDTAGDFFDPLWRTKKEKAQAQREINFEIRRFHNMVGTAIRHRNQQMGITDPNQSGQHQTGLGQDQAVVDGKILGLDMKVLLGAGILIALLIRR